MSRFFREVRLLPLVLLATISLLALKSFGLFSNGSYTLGSPRPVHAGETAAAQNPGGPTWYRLGDPDFTGAVPEKKSNTKDAAKAPPAAKKEGEAAAKPADKPTEKAADKKGAPADKSAAEKVATPREPPPAPEGTVIPLDSRPLSPAERAILARLQDRRQELDQRARELDMRENLMTAAEKRLEARVAELKDLEARINAAMNKRDEAEAARFKSLVTMYENMKAKDAAKIFDRLEPKVLLEVAGQINPRRMSDILAQMTPEAAERLTVELANRARGPEAAPAAGDLPKIEGRPG